MRWLLNGAMAAVGLLWLNTSADAQFPPPALPLSVQCMGSLAAVALSDSAMMTALTAVDAWGKPTGILMGSFTALGDFNECLDMNSKESGAAVPFNYALLKGALNLAQFNVSLGLQWGVCVPAACTALGDIQFLLKTATSALPGGGGNDDDDDWEELKSRNGSSAVEMLTGAARQILMPAVVQLRAVHKADTTAPVSIDIAESHPQRSAEWGRGSVVVLCLFGLVALVTLIGTLWDFHDRARATAQDGIKSTSRNVDNSSPTPSVGSSHASVGTAVVLAADADTSASASASDPLLPTNSSPVAPPRKTSYTGGRQVFACFSLYNTGATLLSCHRSQSMKSLAVLDVLRVMSMWWIVTTHTCAEMVAHLPIDMKYVMAMTVRWDFTFMANAFMGVETFFFLSAFIAAYTLLSNERMTKKFNYGKYVLLRYLRMTPSYVAMMVLYMYIMPHLGRGPTWYTRLERFEYCARYWWSNLLYINNLYPVKMDDECMPWTWYLAADYQFYLVAPLFILLLASPKYRKVGTWVTLAVVALQFVWTFTVSYVNHVPALATLYKGSPDLDSVMAEHAVWQTKFYMQFYNHLSVFLGGIMCAFVCVRYRNTQLRQWQVWACHAVGAFCLLATVYLPYDFIHVSERWSNGGNAAYNYFSRLVWALGLSAVVVPSVICGETKVRLLTAVWQWPFWRVLARLTYGVYLIHCVLINIYFGNYMREVPFSPIYASLVVGGIAFWSYLWSAVLFVAIEAPAANLLKMVMGK